MSYEVVTRPPDFNLPRGSWVRLVFLTEGGEAAGATQSVVYQVTRGRGYNLTAVDWEQIVRDARDLVAGMP